MAENQAPVLDPIENISIKAGGEVNFLFTASDPDEGQSLTLSISGLEENSYNFFQVGLNKWVVLFNDMTPYRESASYKFTVRVTDNGNPALYDEGEATVNVSPNLFTIIVLPAASGGGHVEITPDQPVGVDELITLKAVPDPGYVFTGWTGIGSFFLNGWMGGLTSQIYPLSITTSHPEVSSITVQSNFKVSVAPVLIPVGNQSVVVQNELTFDVGATNENLEQYLTYSLIGAPPGATITDGSDWYPSSAKGKFRWTPTAIGTFTFKIRVTDVGSPSLYDEEEITVTVHNEQFSLVTTVSGNGSITKSPEQVAYDGGSIVQLTVIPESGFEFTGWGDDASGTNNPLAIEMTSNKTITANFRMICSAGIAQVPVITSNIDICSGATVDLFDLVTSTKPAGTSILFFSTNYRSGEPLASPDEATAGTYYAFYKGESDCFNTDLSTAQIVVNGVNCSTLPDLRAYLVMDQVTFTSDNITNPVVFRIRNVRNPTSATSPIKIRFYKPTSAATVALTGGAASDWTLISENENYYEFTSDIDIPYTAAGGYQLTANLTIPASPVKGAFNFRALVVDRSGGETLSDNGNNNVIIGVSKQ